MDGKDIDVHHDDCAPVLVLCKKGRGKDGAVIWYDLLSDARYKAKVPGGEGEEMLMPEEEAGVR